MIATLSELKLCVILYRRLVSQDRRAEPRCSLECKALNSDDYKDLLWTTLSEFPGKAASTFFITMPYIHFHHVPIGSLCANVWLIKFPDIQVCW